MHVFIWSFFVLSFHWHDKCVQLQGVVSFVRSGTARLFSLFTLISLLFLLPLFSLLLSPLHFTSLLFYLFIPVLSSSLFSSFFRTCLSDSPKSWTTVTTKEECPVNPFHTTPSERICTDNQHSLKGTYSAVRYSTCSTLQCNTVWYSTM